MVPNRPIVAQQHPPAIYTFCLHHVKLWQSYGNMRKTTGGGMLPAHQVS
jgi:hypothetical protein